MLTCPVKVCCSLLEGGVMSVFPKKTSVHTSNSIWKWKRSQRSFMVLISFAGGNNLWTTFNLLLKPFFFFYEKLQPGILSFTSPVIIILFIQPCLSVCSAATEALKRRDLLQRHLVLSDSPDLFFCFVPPKRSWGKRCVEDGVKEERVVYQRGRFPWLWCIIVPLLDVTRGKGQTWCLCGDFQPGPACTRASAVFLFFFFLSLGL